jgi:NAD(P)-dependent dehydrogenase (short-subunit alcohol dehydrogenase family)
LSIRLEGKVALIAGAGGRQGTAVPILFAREGAAVVLAGLSGDEVEDIARRIQEDGGQAVAMAADLTAESEAASAVRLALDSFGKLDVLYNNSGGYLDGFIHETTEADWDRLIQQNLKTHYNATRFAIPPMLENGSGSIVNVGAARAARQGGNAVYAATKGGVIAMSQNLAKAYHSRNIRVNCICPTNIGDSRDRYGVPLPLRSLDRDGTPEDVAHLGLFLASDESAWITGAVFVVDGGAEVLG